MNGQEQEAEERARIDARLAAARERLVDERLAVAQFDGSIDGHAITIAAGTALSSRHALVARYPSRFRARTNEQVERRMKSLRYSLEYAAGI